MCHRGCGQHFAQEQNRQPAAALLDHLPESDRGVRRVESLHASHLLHVLSRLCDQLVRMAEARSQLRHDDQAGGRVFLDEIDEVVALELEDSCRFQRSCRRGARRAVKQRQLAEVLPHRESRQRDVPLSAAIADLYCAFFDEVKRRAGISLAHDHLSGREVILVHAFGKRDQIICRKILKERDPRQQLFVRQSTLRCRLTFSAHGPRRNSDPVKFWEVYSTA